MKPVLQNLKLNKVTISNLNASAILQNFEMAKPKRPKTSWGGTICSAQNCPSIDRKTCLCRTQKASCTCPPPAVK